MGKKEQDILLESGTGELEVLKFKVKGIYYAINVIKVQEILEIEYDDIEPLPAQHQAVRGMTSVRDEAVTVIDLRRYLDCDKGEEEVKEQDTEQAYMILTEFNNVKLLFAVDEVIEIARISWADIEEPNRLMGDLVNGVIKLDKKLINFLDFEKILSDVNPEVAMQAEETGYNVDAQYKEKRSKITLALAEDSPTIRNILTQILKEAGYTDLKIFKDGEQLWNYLLELKEETGPEEEITDLLKGIITDIEMPQLDGHTLIKQIKADNDLQNLSTLIFSSLITDKLRHKGREVGADAQISKPEIDDLITILDELVLEED
jgi:two-component system chemotaxis response regulator CheV